MDTLPHRVLTFYGDDFTGSSAVMEVMTFAGLPTVMFLEPPDPARLERFAAYRAIGIASTARSMGPGWMDAHLPAAFEALKALGAPVAHYKVCSTFDSAPDLGSIGRAIELGAPVFGARVVPLVTAAPQIGRWQAFGNLFAAFDGAVHRLDRHPVMARHPATPMHEADLARHLAAQTEWPTALIDLLALKAGEGVARLGAERAAVGEGDPPRIVSMDVVDGETLAAVGAALWAEAGRGVFAAGSQGVEYALIAHWRDAGLLAPPEPVAPIAAVDRMIAVSGSVSPTTAAQIAHAEARGFAVQPLDVAATVDDAAWVTALEAAIGAASAAIEAGRIPLIVTARGPDDPAVARFDAALDRTGTARGEAARRIGRGLGRIVRELVSRHRLTRAVISGGDTSGYATAELGVYALSALAPLAPGAPLCRTWADDPAFDGLELALKGGQMGAADFFVASTGRMTDAPAAMA
ncbi:four-carbon acid sugar kinase family protein [Acuticoccus sp. I52.16.1]|uniref:four-carbon acid sugar kinase family protein n=1 Tax=Acuticoccus sp. I52.16.1 TaxID=2928472 RepID=UPI001FD5871A|nr:four-carbon acid sugar kinase family protein [Acuticoccus sp. I52.16.1]UOM34369.1 four-carbon acid sugar kinase family protein [Acuticoccus sp. I52.16.1]